MLHDGCRALVVDPGDTQPVLAALQQLNLQLDAILVTHHHTDHTGGVAALRKATGAKVFGPMRENMPEPLTRLEDGETLQSLGLTFRVIAVPGHTAGHIAFYSEPQDAAPLLFCGDTLFSAGCGRLFEGTPAQMLASLDRLAALPDTTRVCCTHEYTLSNLKFALAVDPANEDLAKYAADARDLRARQQPTLPSNLLLERQINPFLRTRQTALIQSAQGFDASAHDEVQVFAALRLWKNKF
ncbi:MAG: hydroxyacylglutathione hydrolase [Rhodoferax sp.]|jgi:hydroxyacylglutathione hydrolase